MRSYNLSLKIIETVWLRNPFLWDVILHYWVSHSHSSKACDRHHVCEQWIPKVVIQVKNNFRQVHNEFLNVEKETEFFQHYCCALQLTLTVTHQATDSTKTSAWVGCLMQTERYVENNFLREKCQR
jgi:hypothetical protein